MTTEAVAAKACIPCPSVVRSTSPSRLPHGLRIAAFVAAFVMLALVFHAPLVAASTPTTLSGSNAALASLGGSASASSFAAGYEPAKAIDGSTSTYWASASGTGNLTATFFALYNIGEVHVHMSGVAQPDLDVKADPDGTGTNWVLIKSVRGNTALDVIVTFSLMAAKKVRVDFLTTVTQTVTTTTQVKVCDVWDYDDYSGRRVCVSYHYETHTTTSTVARPPQVAEVEAWGNPNKDTDGDGLADSFEETMWYRQDAIVDGLPKAIPNNGTDVLALTLERPKWAGIATHAFLDLEVDHASPGDLAVAVSSWDGAAWRDRLVWTPGTFANASIWDTVVITRTQTNIYPSKSVSAGTGQRLSLGTGFGSTASASTASSTIWHVTIDLMKTSLDSWETSAGFRAPAWSAADLHGQGSWRLLVRDWNPFATGGTLRSASLRTEERSDPLKADTDGEIADGAELKIGTFPVALDTDFDGLSDLFESNAQSLNLTINGVTSTRSVKTDPAKADTDGDGLSDGEERTLGADRTITDPTVLDTDGDGLWDGYTIGGHLGELSYNTNATRTDTDGDTFSDWTEINARPLTLTINGTAVTRWVTTLPYSADSDGDGLKDNEEWYGTSVYSVVTDPSDRDTDRDGIPDGAEYYIREFALDGRAPLATSGYRTVNAIPQGPIDSVEVRYATSGSDVSTIRIDLGHNGYGGLTLRNGGGSGLYLHESKDITNAFPQTSRSGSYTLYVSAPAGNVVLEEFSIRFKIRTSPIKADTDGDGLTDKEELAPRNDGYVTDPNMWDTDGDGWSDGYEVSRGTNPLNVDTDGDGVWDARDVDPLHNLMVAVTIYRVHVGNPAWTPTLAGVVNVNNDYTYATPHLGATEDTVCYVWFIGCISSGPSTSVFYDTYYADVPDDQWGVSVKVQGWGINCCRNDDLLVDRSITYSHSWSSFSETAWSNDGLHWVSYAVSTVRLDKVRTLAITDGQASITDQYGVPRYTSQQRFAVLLLQATYSYGQIKQGVNAILVPESVFVHTYLRARLQPPAPQAPQSWPLDSVTFYDGDTNKATMSEGIAALIAGDMDGYNAWLVLQWLLQDEQGTAKYLVLDVTGKVLGLNLPSDVVKIIPWGGVQNSATGDMPVGSVWGKITNALVSVGQLIYGGLMAIGNFFVQLGQAIADWGMKALGAIANALNQVKSAIESAGQILGSLLDWVLQEIRQIFEAFAAQLRGLWQSLAGGYVSNNNGALTLSVSDYQATGRIGLNSAAALQAAYTGGPFWPLFGLATGVVAAYLAFVVGTLGLGTLLGAVSGIIATTVASQAFGIGLVPSNIGVNFSPSWGIAQLIQAFLQWLVSSGIIHPDLESVVAAVLGAAFAEGSFVASIYAISLLDASATTATVAGLFFSILSLGFSAGIALGGVVGKAFALFAASLGFLGAFLSAVGVFLEGGLLYKVVALAGAVMGAAGAYLGLKYAT